MEGSASAPVLRNEDYNIPSNGVGATGHPKRILNGNMSKDKGEYSSRINQIIKQAGKAPGPGKYIAHEYWEEGKRAHVIHGGNKFPNSRRDYKPMNKTPDPANYENKNFGLGVSINSSEHISKNPRVLFGNISKAKKRSFLDQAIAHGSKIPAPGHNDTSGRYANKAEPSVKKIPNWSREITKTTGKKAAPPEIGPNHYSIKYPGEEKQPCHAIPKAKAQNFLDKAQVEKMVDLRTRKEIPGPGTYNTHSYDDSKFSRGTKYLQLRGMGRSAVSGYL